MDKICVIYNSAPLYRESIFVLMDSNYDISWYFDTQLDDIKQMDFSKLKDVHQIKNLYLKKPFYWQKGVLCNLFNKKNKIFIILGDTFCLSTWIFMFLKMIFYREKKVFFWTHGWYGKESGIIKILKRIYFNMPDGLFLYGNYAKKLMIQEGFNSKKLFVIHNSLRYEDQLKLRTIVRSSNIYRDYFKNDKPVLLFIGRLTPEKKLHLLVDALNILKKRGEEYNLSLIGDGESKDQLYSLVNECELSDQVWFYGSCYDEKTNAELIYNADLCVSPGNVGLTAMHSLVFGCPVITHSCFEWQMPEFEAIQPGLTGDFFKMDDVNSLVNSIHDWFSKKRDLREEVRSNCYNEIDSQWNPYFQLKVLKNVLKQ